MGCPLAGGMQLLFHGISVALESDILLVKMLVLRGSLLVTSNHTLKLIDLMSVRQRT